MSSRKNVLSLATAFMMLIAILAGCVAGSTVRNDTPNNNPTPTPTPSATTSPTASPSPSASASVSPSPSPTAVVGTQTVLDTGRTNIFDVAQDNKNFYYSLKVANNGAVMAVPKAGGAAVTLVSGANADIPWGVTCDPGDGGYVYYTENLPNPQGSILRVQKPVSGVTPTATPEILATGLSSPTFCRLNFVNGGDGLLYTCENVNNDGRILRFRTDTLNQSRDAATFISNSGQAPPGFNLHLFSFNGVATLVFTMMDENLVTGANGQLRTIATSATPASITATNLVATGLLNPTDVWPQAVPGGGINLLWTEYDSSAGSVRKASLTDNSVRGTPIGVATNSLSLLPPASIKVDQLQQIAVVTRNLQQVNGGAFMVIDLATDRTFQLQVSIQGQLSGGINFPFQFDGTGTGLVGTEFNYGQGATGLDTQPSNLIFLGPSNVTPGAKGQGFDFSFNGSR